MNWKVKEVSFPQGLLLMMAIIAAFIPGLALAEYWGMDQAPDWEGHAGYTRQSWGFGTEPGWQAVDLDSDGDTDAFIVNGDGYAADHTLANSHGGAYLIRSDFGDAFSWDWVDEGPMDQDWEGLQGLIGGMGSGAVDLVVHSQAPAGHTKELWVQYVIFIPNGSDGAAVGMVLAADSDFAETRGTRVMKDWRQIHELDSQGGSGDWFRVTELWQVATPSDTDYLRIVSADHGTANMIDSVDVLTRAVDTAAPVLSATMPGDGDTGITIGTVVRLTFSKRMDTRATLEAFSVIPAVAGTVAWSALDTVLAFTPDAPLATDTSYSVTVGTGAMDTNGNHPAEPLVFGFTTRAHVAPKPSVNGAPEGTVAENAVSLAVSGDGVFGYRFRLDGGDWSGSFKPAQALALTDLSDGPHTLEIEVLDGLGTWIPADTISWTVMAPPTVLSVDPRGNVPAPATISVTFSEPMDPETVRTAFDIVPPVTGTFSWDGAGMIYTAATPLAENTRYTVTIGVSAADTAGNQMTEPVSWEFTTLAAQTLRCPIVADTYVLFGGMGGGAGYPRGSSQGEYKLKAGAVSIVDARALMRFDLSPLTDKGLAAADIVRAELVYTMLGETATMDVGPPAPAGIPMHGFIHVLDAASLEKTGAATAPHYWTEAVSGEDYVHMDNKPWYVPGAPWVLARHDTGPDTTGAVEITHILRGWLDRRWPNNGIELRDRDDQSDPDSEWGDGYSWHLASREDLTLGPYLRVTYDTGGVRITDATVAAQPMRPHGTRLVTASGGGQDGYQWRVTGPGGVDITPAVLSSAAGQTVAFTALAASGLYTLGVTSGEKTDRVFIGVSPEDPVNPRAPLYMDAAPGEQTLLNGICSSMLDRMGRSGSLDQVMLVEAGKETRIGGRGLDDGGAMVIGVIADPAGLAASEILSLVHRDERRLAMEIDRNSLSGYSGRLYAVAADTGRDAHGGASGICLFGLFTENGTPLAPGLIRNLRLTIPYDASVVADGSFESGEYGVFQAGSMGDFFSGAEAASKTVIAANAISDVDPARETVTFSVGGCDIFGVLPAAESSGDGFDDEPGESLSSGCFIDSLF